MTTTLNARREDVPEELTSSVDTLTDTLKEVEDPDTSPQDREAVTDSAREVASALTVISDDSTPVELREQLTVLVKQVTSTLEAGQEPDVPPEDRSRLFLVVKRTTAALDTVTDSATSPKLQGLLPTIITDLNYASEQGRGGGELGVTALRASSSMDLLSDSHVSQKQREELAEETARVSRLLRRASDPKSSPQERAEARQEMRDRTSRMKDEQEDASSGQEPPDASLGKAAEVCATAIFDTVSDRKLARGLKDLTPSSWDSEGVRDFWKASEEGDNVLDVRAQLRNNEHTHAPFQVAQLITGLAEILAGKDLIGTLGGKSTAHCRQTAVYLEEEGVTAGDWLTTDEG